MKISDGMNLLEVATLLGNTEQLFEVAELNGVDITDELQTGIVLQLPVLKVSEKVKRQFVTVAKQLSVVVYNGQTLIDISMQELGDAGRLFELAAFNGIDITTDILPGQILKTLEPDVDKRNIVSTFYNNKLKPASSVYVADLVKQAGINYWIIEDDFEVQ